MNDDVKPEPRELPVTSAQPPTAPSSDSSGRLHPQAGHAAPDEGRGERADPDQARPGGEEQGHSA